MNRNEYTLICIEKRLFLYILLTICIKKYVYLYLWAVNKHYYLWDNKNE